MKIKLDIDCTAEEARAFLGLPDVAPVQEAVMEEVQERLLKNMQLMDPEQMFKTWFPIAVQGVEDVRKFFTEAATGKGRKRAKSR